MRTSPWRRGHCCRRGTGVIVVIRLSLLPTPLGHCCHPDADDTASPCRCCGAGIIAVLESRKLPWCRLGRTLPWLHCHRCCHGAGVLVALASSRTLPWRCLGIAAIAALVSLQTSPWRCYHCCVVALPSSRRWRHCGRCPGAAGASSPFRRWHPCGRRPGTVAIVAVATLASLQRWHHCGRYPGAAWALLPSRHWRHHRRCLGTVANIAVAALASPRSLQWRHCQRCLGTITVVALVLLSLSCWRHCLGGIALATWTSVHFFGVGPLGASAAISSCCRP